MCSMGVPSALLLALTRCDRKILKMRSVVDSSLSKLCAAENLTNREQMSSQLMATDPTAPAPRTPFMTPRLPVRSAAFSNILTSSNLRDSSLFFTRGLLTRDSWNMPSAREQPGTGESAILSLTSWMNLWSPGAAAKPSDFSTLASFSAFFWAAAAIFLRSALDLRRLAFWPPIPLVPARASLSPRGDRGCSPLFSPPIERERRTVAGSTVRARRPAATMRSEAAGALA
mmetsp:Transcript_70898/g.160401  ORF Transcript_70898/g.160401 Transcript_70898/m.160401 type:complete len:229 (-) Transcript_70898:189-875(-)